MEDFKIKKSAVIDWKRSYVTLFVLILVLFFSTRSALFAFNKYKQAKHLLALEEEKLKNYENRYDSLTASISSFETERGKEDVIREKFQFVKPGEQIIVILDKEGNEESEVGNKTSIFLKILRFLGIK